MGNEVIFIVSVIALIFYLVISKFLKNNIKEIISEFLLV